MAKTFAICAVIIALVVIAESKSISVAEEPCPDCPQRINKRIKRAEAPAILNSIAGLVTSILDTSWSYITKIHAMKLAAQRKPTTVIIGPGQNNENRVIINHNGYSNYNNYNDYNSRSGYYQPNQKYQGNQWNQRNDYGNYDYISNY